jgi:membrane-associated phospholipid phosphatase/outer membrane protein assembly factor BamB
METIDLEIERAIQAFHPAWLDALTNASSWIGFPPQSTLIDAILVLAIFLTGHRWAAVCAVFAAAGSAGLWFLIAPLVHRPRPTPDLVRVAAEIPFGSFPSGHVLNITAFFGFLAFLSLVLLPPGLIRRVFFGACSLLVILIGYARIYSGEHWPSDVLAGYVLGAAWLWITIHVYRWGSRRRASWLAAGLLAVCLACGAPTPEAAAPISAVSPSPNAASPSPVASPATAIDQADWPTYQHDLARTGQAVGTFDAANEKLLWESDQLDGQVYAQVLVVGNRAIAATQNNTIYALDVATGRAVWSVRLGDPVPRSALPCGNVDPTGILSTPTIDPATGVLYAVDFIRQPPHHELVAIDIITGTVRFNQPIDPPGASPLPHQQRAALAASNGNVYVPFGGLFGDCGDYHGWVISAAAGDGHQIAAYQVPTHREGAIWAAAALSSAGDLYVATGNGDSTTDFDQANAVVRLSPDLKLLDFFAPANWADLSRRDADLGSSFPTLLESGQILQVGKSGVGYLLAPSRLGQIGGEVFQAPLCGGGAYGGSAHSGSTVYHACRDGLYAVQVQDRAFSVLWHGPQFNAGAPTITEGSVWTVDDGTASLYALNQQNGSIVFRAPAGQSTNPPHFLTPSAARGRVFHSRGQVIVAYGAG